MKERPILFSAPMVRAILGGPKTQTRRVIKPKVAALVAQVFNVNGRWGWDTLDYDFRGLVPYGQPGDRLWVRETWGVGTRPHPIDGWIDGIEYRADEPLCDGIENMPLHRVDQGVDLNKYDKLGWKPSIHMPRWASRITLEIESVRVEHLQDISEEDAKAEGCEPQHLDDLGQTFKTYKRGFRSLWESINGQESWDANPWVWVIGFKRITP